MQLCILAVIVAKAFLRLFFGHLRVIEIEVFQLVFLFFSFLFGVLLIPDVIFLPAAAFVRQGVVHRVRDMSGHVYFPQRV